MSLNTSSTVQNNIAEKLKLESKALLSFVNKTPAQKNLPSNSWWGWFITHETVSVDVETKTVTQ